ncbi:septum formation initiator family protein [Arthrobacter sulfonylureivorans]|uniref:FtsB family cell division protein n=1 Tax=Arthrobacter sulfonylureivorans TaxID=2486855 RepID=UPI0039E2A928
MSTRRPNMPRAGRPAGSGPAQGGGQGTGTDTGRREPETGKVIRADFGRTSAAPVDRASVDRAPAGSPSTPEAGHRRRPKPKPAPSEARAAERRQLSGGIRQPVEPAVRREPREPAREAPADAVPVPAKAFSGRLLALAVVLVSITVLLAPSVRVFIEQRAELAALQADIAAKKDSNEQLTKELARWDDPAYIKQQARDRIFYVMPGEKRYMVTGAEGLGESDEHASATAPEDLPWVDALWNSMTRAATDAPAAD